MAVDESPARDGDATEIPDTEAAWQKKRRQAVLVIHGMGEQRPLDTLREFVRTVYQRDLDLTRNTSEAWVDDPEYGKINRVWVVPDKIGGSAELRRITTKMNDNHIRTDFYEFYWADIMDNNPLDLVIAWLRGLLLRSPYDVPRSVRMWTAWLMLWAAVVIVLLLAQVVARPDDGVLADWVGRFADWLGAAQQLPLGTGTFWPLVLIAVGVGLAAWRLWLARPVLWHKLELAVALVVAGGVLLLVPDGWAPPLPQTWAATLGVILALTGAIFLAVRLLTTEPQRKTAFLLPVLLFGVGVALLGLPIEVYAQPAVVAGAATAVAGFAIHGFIVPYFGDVVRYARANPSTVAKREEIRQRGLKVLRRLHGLPEDGSGEPQSVEAMVRAEGDKSVEDGLAKASPGYERVIVVAHSLGAMIAYDLLLHFWEEVGPNHKRAGSTSKAIEDACTALDKKVVSKVWGEEFSTAAKLSPEELQVLGFDELQHEVFAALRDEVPKGWRISHFVTLGSPLVHAEFLSFDDRRQLARAFSERGRASSPPGFDWPRHSMMYRAQEVVTGEWHSYAHFAAVFAAVKWTNIYDLHDFPLFGDVVSGPVADIFGPGVKDRPVTICWSGVLPPFDRFVTHTEYWTWPEGWTGSSPPPWVQTLRDALDLAGEATQPRAAPPNRFAAPVPQHARQAGGGAPAN